MKYAGPPLSSNLTLYNRECGDTIKVQQTRGHRHTEGGGSTGGRGGGYIGVAGDEEAGGPLPPPLENLVSLAEVNGSSSSEASEEVDYIHPKEYISINSQRASTRLYN